MEELIKEKLAKIEHEHQIKIIYACESGSRAWGFPSKDSDYDIRFIYLRKKDWYLSIDDKKDTLEFPLDGLLDFSGWDFRKTLKLFRASNAVVYEWFQSPIIYQQVPDFLIRIKALFPDFFSLRAGMHHYLSMAKNCFEQDLQDPQIKLKKYFYALRPVLSCKWMAEKKETPPMEFGILRQLIAGRKELNSTIEALLNIKLAGDEKDLIAPIPFIHSFIVAEINALNKLSDEFQKVKNDTVPLDVMFQEFLQKYDG